MSTRTNILLLALLTFFIVNRIWVYGGDNGTNLPTRLDAAAHRLVSYYRDNAARPGWRVAEVHAEEKSVAVRVEIAAGERRALTVAPEDLQTAGLAAFCPVYNHPVWDLFSGGQHIRVDGVDDAGEVFVSRKCRRRDV